MRIVIDMQGAQSTGSRHRGIGRYTVALAHAMVRNRCDHEILLALSGLFPESIQPIRDSFSGILPQENIRVWHAPAPVNFNDPSCSTKRLDAERIYATFLHSLSPDVVHVTNIFEGFVDDAVTTIPRDHTSYKVAVTLYDLIPLLNPDPYLLDSKVHAWYHEKIEHLRHADIWLAISESSQKEGIASLKFPPENCFNISSDADPMFRPLAITSKRTGELRKTYGINKKFVMYTGGIDHRKNIDGLIRAFAQLPPIIRQNYQLAIVCSIQQVDRERLMRVSAEAGLVSDQLVLTGYIPDVDLVDLYNLCSLFVFPSLHEGFGLPALEAMRCGAPTIAAHSSSLPEVVGWDNALFDPKSVDSMSMAMLKALSDDTYRNELMRRQAKHSQSFSWDVSARKAIAAMHAAHSARPELKTHPILKSDGKRLRMAYVSPLPTARSGIADYSAELLPELSQYYDIELVVAQTEPLDSGWINSILPIRTPQWLIDHASDYDRVLYHMGNSAYHKHMFELLDRVPGVIVLHDFYLSDVLAHLDTVGNGSISWLEALYDSHGYHAVQKRLSTHDISDLVWRFPANLPLLQKGIGVIVHSSHAASLASYWYGSTAATNWSTIPLLRVPAEKSMRAEARKRLGIGEMELLVCSFGVVGSSKLNHRIIEAWLASSLSNNDQARLVFVGQNEDGEYGRRLSSRIDTCDATSSISITGWVSRELFRDYLAAADIAVQLRSFSRGETSAAVLDCMNHGLATIVNAHGAMSDLDPEGVILLPDDFTDKELLDSLTELASNPLHRREIGSKAREIIRTRHSPASCAKLYTDSIETSYLEHNEGLSGLLKQLSSFKRTEPETIELASSLGLSFPEKPRLRQLFVDVSELMRHDALTGIQRVVRNILQAWLAAPPLGFRIEPVYAHPGHGYRYAREFTGRFLGFDPTILADEPIDFVSGDVFFGLDLQPHLQSSSIDFYEMMRRQGVVVKFMVYDLLCIRSPEFFQTTDVDNFSRWLRMVATTDGAVCISNSVADDLRLWMQENMASRLQSFSITWAHLGADIRESRSTTPANSAKQFHKVGAQGKSFLMVGTLEPRKGHLQVLQAFESLWKRGFDLCLVLVGKQGWMVQDLCRRVLQHTELNKRLFWFERINDGELENLYNTCTCLISASYGEGFGLPLIEAAQYRLPIITRDIPIFREIAGDNAFYFNSSAPDELASAIERWLDLHINDQHPKADDIPWLTWKQSANLVLDALDIQSMQSTRI